MPGDSIGHELSLEAGDQVTWNLWLAAGSANSGTATLTFWSSAKGELWQRSFGSEAADVREDIKITQPARYRLTLKSDGPHGRAADLNAWTKYGPGNRTPFPPPDVQRIAEPFAAGDRYIIEFEFLFSDTIQLQTLRELDLPRNLVSVWAITPHQDSVAATASVSRWMGDAGIIRLQERAPHGGSITLQLELEIGESGESTVFIAPGSHPPAWVPASARVTTRRLHQPWNSVIVPPQREEVARQPEPPRAKYAAISFRARGLDSSLVRELTEIYSERDSLIARRYARRQTVAGYDTLFLMSRHAFLPPDLQVVLTAFPESPTGPQAPAHKRTVTWFVDGEPADVQAARLYEWRYDEARLAMLPALDELFWDSTYFDLNPGLQKHHAAGSDHAATLTIPPPKSPELNPSIPRSYRVQYQSVWALYLENPTEDTLVLAWHPAVEIERPLLTGWKTWPLVTRIALLIFAVLAALGVAALIEMRRREKRRKVAVAELDQELDKARQVQLKLLPAAPLNVQGIEIYGLHQSMQSVGGDYYDFFPLEDGSILLCVADVAGHGLSAAMLMSNLQATLHAIGQTGKPLSEMMALMNREMFQRTSPERHVTMLLARVSADRSLITVCNAGHNPGYIVRTTGNVVELDAGGIMLGVMDVFPFIQMDEGLDPGDIVAFYTDGIPEAEVGPDDMFGYDRLKYFLTNNRSERLPDIAQSLFRRVTSPGNGVIADDMAIVLLRIKPERAPDSQPRAASTREKHP